MGKWVRLFGFTKDFTIDQWFLARWFVKLGQKKHRIITVIGPFELSLRDKILLKLWSLTGRKADFFVTGENKKPDFDRAKKQIGFWRSYADRDDVLRFPNWMWHLDWPGVSDQPAYSRYGMRLSIDRLLRPIEDTYAPIKEEVDRLNRAVIFTGHLNEPRNRLYQLTNETLGCDGYGRAFRKGTRNAAKMPVLEKYMFCLCPENTIGDGYVTEKIPEAFHAGCIPITWCRPEDLAEDFNEEAVVNLYGLNDGECRKLLERLRDDQFVQKKRQVPLLKYCPNLDYLQKFILE